MGNSTLLAIAILVFIGATARMIGEFFRQVAVLLVIFVPLELWKPQLGEAFGRLMWHVGEGTVLFLALGMFMEYVAVAAFRIKRDLEGGHGSE